MAWLLGGELGPSGSLSWTSPDWVVVVAAAVALLAFAASVRGSRPLGARVAEGVAFALALLGLVVALARPVWVEEEGRTVPGRLAVVVDASASMAVREGAGARSDAARALLDRVLAEGDDVDVFHLGDGLSAGPPTAFDLPGTDLESALRALGDRYAGEKLAGVVVITDGLDRGPLRRSWLRGGDPVPPKLPGPLTLFGVGQTGATKDLAVRWVDAGGYAYVHTPFRIRAELVGIGFEGQEVQAELLQDGRVVTSSRVRLDEAGEGEATFEVTPDRPGRFSFLVQVPDYEQDAVLANNVMPVVVRVVRDKIRVLQVAGAPSWDVKFLRRFLKGDPSVDLVSFFILRTRRDMGARWNEKELSLIEFPYRQLFNEELASFDLVIFQNFDYHPYFEHWSAELLGNVARVTRDLGHGFAMVGGDRSFSLGDYGRTPLPDILPVEVSGTRSAPDPTPFQPTLTDAGRRHPITRLVADATENEAWWGRLHALDGTNTGLTARSNAAVLLEHPTLKDKLGKPLPVLSVSEAGKGRAMALSVDTSWRWSLSEAAVGRGNQAYLRFWKGAIRWLIGDPTTARVMVDTHRENYAVGDEVRILVRARDQDFAPLVDGPVRVEVSSSGWSASHEATTGPEGEAVITVPAERRGAHRVDVVVGTGPSADVASTVYAVTSRDPELDEVAPDPAFLAWLAARTDGRFVPAGETEEPLRDASAGRTLWTRHEVAVWRSPVLAAWIALFAGIAWILRRRAGLR
ncbi:MAG: hypothetical protein H6732_13970 [Alphaproteobacteria bacterium]|nr:hypothetical protein [Alphaproteobacteria bacterium]